MPHPPEPPEIAADDNTQPAYASIPVEQRIRGTEELMTRRATDVARWRNPQNFKANWSNRAQIVANLIPSGTTVLDLGCGMMDLEACLPADCTYLPADLAPRDGRTLYCDLNSGEIPRVAADIVTMLGVIEYIHDPRQLFALLSDRWSSLILTYNPADRDAGRDRRKHGWFCNLTSAQMVEAAATAGFALIGQATIDVHQVVYEFCKGAPGSETAGPR